MMPSGTALPSIAVQWRFRAKYGRTEDPAQCEAVDAVVCSGYFAGDCAGSLPEERRSFAGVPAWNFAISAALDGLQAYPAELYDAYGIGRQAPFSIGSALAVHTDHGNQESTGRARRPDFGAEDAGH